MAGLGFTMLSGHRWEHLTACICFFFSISYLPQQLLMDTEGCEGIGTSSLVYFPHKVCTVLMGMSGVRKGVSIIQEDRFQGPHPWTPATQASLLSSAPLRPLLLMYLKGRTPLSPSHASKEPVSQADKFCPDAPVPVPSRLDVLDRMT